MKSHRGFTLVEVIIVVALAGLLALIAMPFFGGVRESANDAAVSALCEALDQAKQAYRLDSAAAGAAWASAPNDDARYGLINPYLPQATPNLHGGPPNGYIPSGYTVTLNGLSARTTAVGPNGTVPR